MVKNARGMSLMELVVVIIMMNILFFSSYAIYNVAVSSWQIGVARCEIIPQNRIAVEKMSRDILAAIEVKQLGLSSLQIKTPDGKKYFYYLYNKEDPWPTSPPYESEIYDLRRCEVTFGFKYGSGTVIVKDVKSLIFITSPDMVSVDLMLQKSKDEKFQLFTKLHPRNLSL